MRTLADNERHIAHRKKKLGVLCKRDESGMSLLESQYVYPLLGTELPKREDKNYGPRVRTNGEQIARNQGVFAGHYRGANVRDVRSPRNHQAVARVGNGPTFSEARKAGIL